MHALLTDAAARKRFVKSRAAIAVLLCVFAFLVMMFSGLGDGFNRWSPWSPRLVETFLTADGGTQAVFYDAYADAALRFGMSTVAMAMFGVVGFFAARELCALLFGRNRTCFITLLCTMYIWHMAASMCYLVASSFYNDYALGQDGAMHPTYVIFDARADLDAAVRGGLGALPPAAVRAHDLAVNFNVGTVAIHDGRSFATFLVVLMAGVGIVLSVSSDFAMMRATKVSARRHAKVFVPLHLCLQFALFAASYTLIVRGWQTLLFITLLPIATDSYSFAIGRKFGKEKLIPSVSPKKTWGGAVWGTAAATASMFAMVLLYAAPTFAKPYADGGSPAQLAPQAADPHNMIVNVFVVSFYNSGSTFRVYWWVVALFFVLVSSLFATGGDLSFSLVKRRYGIKDFGTSLGSHGGVLDRIDSMVAVYVMYFVYLLLVSFVSGRSFLDMNANALNLLPPSG